MSKEQIDAQVMQAQGFAVDIEITLGKIFKCQRGGFGGMVDADAIRKHPFLSMAQGLAYLYAIDLEKRESIEKFLTDFSFYSEFSLDYLLSFDTNEKAEGIGIIGIEKENGLEQVKYMIDEFDKVVE